MWYPAIVWGVVVECYALPLPLREQRRHLLALAGMGLHESWSIESRQFEYGPNLRLHVR